MGILAFTSSGNVDGLSVYTLRGAYSGRVLLGIDRRMGSAYLFRSR